MCQCGQSSEHSHIERLASAVNKSLNQYIENPRSLNGTPKIDLVLSLFSAAGDSDGTNATGLKQASLDDPLIVSIPFSAFLRIKSVMIAGTRVPSKLNLFVNNPSFDFSSLSSTPSQTINLFRADSGESPLLEYSLKPHKFSNVNHVAMVFGDESQVESEPIDITKIIFVGEFVSGTAKPVIATYEARARAQDHKSIKSIESTTRKDVFM